MQILRAVAYIVICGVVFCAAQAVPTLLSQHENAILAMTPMQVAPWLLDLSAQVRNKIVRVLPEDNLQQFDTAIGLLREPCVHKSVLKHLKKTRVLMRSAVVQSSKQLKQLFMQNKKKAAADVRALKKDFDLRVRERALQVAEILQGLTLLEQEIAKAFVWFKKRRVEYLRTGQYASLNEIKDYSKEKKSFSKKEYAKMHAATRGINVLATAHKRALLALRSERESCV